MIQKKTYTHFGLKLSVLFLLAVLSCLPEICQASCTEKLSPAVQPLDSARFLQGTGIDFSGAFDFGSIKSGTDVAHTFNTAYSFDHYGSSANDVFYRFELDRPMAVVFDNLGSSVSRTNIYLVKLGTTEDFDIDLKDVECGQDWDYALKNFDYLEYERSAYSTENKETGISYNFLDEGIYYVICERAFSNAGGKGAIIQTNFHFHSVNGASIDNPISLGAISENFDSTAVIELKSSEMKDLRNEVFASFELENYSVVNITGAIGIFSIEDSSGLNLYNATKPDDIFTSELEKGKYFIRIKYSSDSDEIVILHISAHSIIRTGDCIDAPLQIGTFSSDFSKTLTVTRPSFLSFSVKQPMSFCVKNTTHSSDTCQLHIIHNKVKLYSTQGREIDIRALDTGTYIIYVNVGSSSGDYAAITLSGKVLTGTSSFSQDYNYIVSYSPTAPIQDRTELSSNNSLMNIRYYDHFGRGIQNNLHKQSPEGNDLVSGTEYDMTGRISRRWSSIPYLKDGGIVSTSAMAWAAEETLKDSTAYTDIEYDIFDRVKNSSGPGKNWKDNEISIQSSYSFNSTGCRRFIIGNDGTIIEAGYYKDSTLRVETTFNEDGHKTTLYYDGRGHKILERERYDYIDDINLDTYYVYDDLGRLRFVLPPEASDIDNISLALDDYAFIYRYGKTGRLTWKKIPGAGWTRYLYDRHNDIIGRQDSLMRVSGVFELTVPDDFGREAVKVVVDDCFPDSLECVDLRATYDAVSKSYIWASSSEYKKYQIPEIKDIRNLVSMNFYDSYQNPAYTSEPLSSPDSSDADTHGLLTGIFRASVSSDDTVYTSFRYDYRGRIIETTSSISNNYSDKVETRYNLIGDIESRIETATVNGRTDILCKEMEYDIAGRLIKETSRLNDSRPAVISFSYGDSGLDGQTAFQLNDSTFNIADTYNIRGWLTSRKSKEFEIKIDYESSELTNNVRYSGLVSAVQWNFPQIRTIPQVYIFGYDALSRLTAGRTYNMNKVHNETLSYDRNGNIYSVLRIGPNKTYTNIQHKHHGNQLLLSFINDDAAVHYAYDGNGNMTFDGADNLNIRYNYLNQVRSVSRDGSKLADYVFTSDGTKLSATDADGNGLVYIGNFTYKKLSDSLSLESAPFCGGRFKCGETGIEPVFYLEDNVGSIRVILDYDGNMIEANEYYPSGVRWTSPDLPSSTFNRFRFNGKEEQNFLGIPYLDYGARMYDSQYLLSWLTLDKCSESFYSISPYSFCAGNSMLYSDPDGNRITMRKVNANNDGKNRIIPYTPMKRLVTSDEFYLNTNNALNEMYSNGGKSVLDRLIQSERTYYIDYIIDNEQKKRKDRDYENFQFRAYKSGNGGSILANAFFNENYDKTLYVESLAHELFHALQYDYSGISSRSIHNELEAYAYSNIIYNNYRALRLEGYSRMSMAEEIRNGKRVAAKYSEAYNEIISGREFAPETFNRAVRLFKRGANQNATKTYQSYKLGLRKSINLLYEYYPE